MRHSLRHLLPRQLTLRAQQLGGVFHHQHRSRPSMRKFKARTGNGQVHGAAPGVKFNLGRCRTHAVPAADHARKVLRAIGRQQILNFLPAQAHLLAPAHQCGEGAVGLQHHARAVQRDNPRRNRLDNRLKLAAALLNRKVGPGQLRGRAFG